MSRLAVPTGDLNGVPWNADHDPVESGLNTHHQKKTRQEITYKETARPDAQRFSLILRLKHHKQRATSAPLCLPEAKATCHMTHLCPQYCCAPPRSQLRNVHTRRYHCNEHRKSRRFQARRDVRHPTSPTEKTNLPTKKYNVKRKRNFEAGQLPESHARERQQSLLNSTNRETSSSSLLRTNCCTIGSKSQLQKKERMKNQSQRNFHP